jgi:hypothetical protein
MSEPATPVEEHKTFFQRLLAWIIADNKSLSPEQRIRVDSVMAVVGIGAGIVLGVLLIILFAFQPASNFLEYLRIVAVTGMIALAANIAGAIPGFLFGVPRAGDLDSGAGGGAVDSGRLYRPNTNLEQISDWLTKILVGVGLTQIGNIPGALDSISRSVIKGMPAGSESYYQPFVTATMIYFFACGFLFGYLTTRLFIGQMIRHADTQLMAKVNKLAEEQIEAQKRDEAEVKVSELVRHQLERSTDDTQISVDELGDALKAARKSTRLDLFDRVRNLRRLAWREKIPDIRPIERTLPIFEALAQTNTDGIRHRTYGEIGFALKDIQLARRAMVKDDPKAWMQRDKWQAAADALTKAIAIRKQQGDDVGHLYEVNRAICNIVLDEQFRNGRPSTPANVKQIVADLQYAVTDPHPWIFRLDRRNPDWMNEHEIVQQWLRLNADSGLPDALQREIMPVETPPAKDAAAAKDEAAE